VRLLLDTHVLFWWLIDEARLSPQAFDKIRTKDDEVFVSVASAWEMAIKVGSGKWPEARALLDDFEGLVSAENFRLLPMSVAHVRDDRLLAAQSMREGLTIVTADATLRALGAPSLW